MAPPGKPSAPVVTAQTADSLTVDWPALGGFHYLLRARDPADSLVELSDAVAPAIIVGLVANEIFRVTLEAVNGDGASGESSPAIGWTDPPTPKAPPLTFVSTDGTVSIGWDLTVELANLRHRETIALEVGRSDGNTLVPKAIAAGKIRDLCFDLGAPFGKLRYQLRLRADRPPPKTPAFSGWGPATAVSKLTPAGAAQERPPNPIDVASPLTGGLAFSALAFLAAKNDDDDDDEPDHGPPPQKKESQKEGGAAGEQAGERARGPSSSDNEEDTHGPSANDKVDDRHVCYLPFDPATQIRTPENTPYEFRETDHGVEGRRVERDGDGWRALQDWQDWDHRSNREMPADPNSLLEFHGMMPVSGPALPESPKPRPTPNFQSNEDREVDTGPPVGQSFFRLPPEPAEQRSRGSVGAALRADRAENTLGETPAARSSRTPRSRARKAQVLRVRGKPPASESLLERFTNWLKSEFAPAAPSKKRPTAKHRNPAEGTFPQEVQDAATASEKKWGVPAKVTLAQWALESGWGRHMPPGSNNPFGIKIKPGSKQDYVEAWTWEKIKGKKERVKAKFRAFKSVDEAFDLHGRLLAKSRSYRNAMKVNDDPEAFADALTGVYATDDRYGEKLKSNMRKYQR